MIPVCRRAQRDFWLHKLDESLHVRSRVRVDAAAQVRAAGAQTERIERVAGTGSTAAGDAATSFDPLSSHRLTHALETGRLAGLAACAALAGEDEPLAAYGRHLSRHADESEVLRNSYYETEARWPESPFWARRRRWVRPGFGGGVRA
jgi:flavin-dependent dehydrogenase